MRKSATVNRDLFTPLNGFGLNDERSALKGDAKPELQLFFIPICCAPARQQQEQWLFFRNRYPDFD